MNEPEAGKIAGLDQLIQVRPVGVVRNNSHEASWGPSFSALKWKQRAARMEEQREAVSEIIVDPSLEGILDGIEDFSHLEIFFWAHLVPLERCSQTRVHPMGNPDFPLIGIFATRSPVRPNSILSTVVRLLERKRNTLKVSGFDALDGSPVLDIKPFTQEEKYENIKVPGWMREIHREFENKSN